MSVTTIRHDSISTWTEPEYDGLFQVSRYPVPSITYADGDLVITGGANGMAGSWDYAIVEMVKNQRLRGSEKPSPIVELDPEQAHEEAYRHVEFFRASPHHALAAGCRRLVTTHLRMCMITKDGDGRPVSVIRELPLLTGYALTVDSSGRTRSLVVELQQDAFHAAGKFYHCNDPLPAPPIALLPDSRIEAAIYHIARQWAGTGRYEVPYKSLYLQCDFCDHCTYRTFCLNLRKIILLDGLPHYSLAHKGDADGSRLIIQHR